MRANPGPTAAPSTARVLIAINPSTLGRTSQCVVLRKGRRMPVRSELARFQEQDSSQDSSGPVLRESRFNIFLGALFGESLLLVNVCLLPRLPKRDLGTADVPA